MNFHDKRSSYVFADTSHAVKIDSAKPHAKLWHNHGQSRRFSGIENEGPFEWVYINELASQTSESRQ